MYKFNWFGPGWAAGNLPAAAGILLRSNYSLITF